MSFGYGTGDVIAILNLFERVALEVRSYRTAPQHFQQLGAELQLLQRTLQRLLQTEPSGTDEIEQLEHIRAIAIHCHQPIQAFINKMRPSEKSLGHSRSCTTLSTVGRRLHWSLITKKDVDELRKVVMSEMVAINVLLGMQQLSSLEKLKAGVDPATKGKMNSFCAQSQKFFSNTTHGFDNLGTLPTDLADLQTAIAEQTLRDTQTSTQVIGQLDTISSSSRLLISQGDSTVTKLGILENQVSRSISTLISIAMDVKEILRRLQTFSKDFSEMILANGRKLIDIHAMMKRLVRAVEAIPLHLTLAIVRLDDALGESWALPYQACQTLHGFEQVLKRVVFSDGRPGAGHVELGRFIIRSVNGGASLNTHTWEHVVKEGAHLTQAMVLSETNINPRRCLFADCNGVLDNNGNCCLICGRTSSFERRMIPLLGLTTTSHDSMIPSIEKRRKGDRGIFGPLLPDNKLKRDDIKMFRNVHLVERTALIESVAEAEKILSQDPSDSNAYRYLGWYLLQDQEQNVSKIKAAVTHLKNSIVYDPTQLESHYLLGRGHMLLLLYQGRSPEDHLRHAYNAYQEALYADGDRSSTVLMSIALLYFYAGQYYDCHDIMSRSIRLDPYEPLVWRNIGILYDNCNHQEEDVIAAFTRAFDLGLEDSECHDRLRALQQYRLNGTPLSSSSMQMIDSDLRTATYDTHEVDEHGPVEIADLRLADDSDDADSDDWETASDE